MGRHTGPTGKLSRREGINLFLKGARSHSDKNAIARKPFAPGQHGNNKRKPRLSNYGVQLREKQKVKRTYGMRERQFKNLYKEANRLAKVKQTDKGLELLTLLETRLDNVVYMLGLAPSRPAARQYVTHRHVRMNGNIASVPSMKVQIGDVIEIKEGKEILLPVEVLNKIPDWLQVSKGKGEVMAMPTREMIDEGIKENLIIEFYSR